MCAREALKGSGWVVLYGEEGVEPGSEHAGSGASAGQEQLS